MAVLRGSLCALVTPMDGRGEVDHGALKELVEWHISEGTDGLVPCGTTGESATLTHEEHERVIETVIRAAAGRITVVAGTGSNSTSEAVRLTKHAADAGADAALVITPYYNKPTQDGLVRHFHAVAEAVEIPIIMYNVPGRTGVNMLPETVARAAENPRIRGIKEATGNLRQVSEVVTSTPADFVLLSGDDFTTLPALSVGGKGVISVSANIAPRLVSEMIGAWETGSLDKALSVHELLMPLNTALFLETNPIPVKAAVRLMGMCGPAIRPPLYEAAPATIERIRDVMRELGLL